MKKIEFKEEMKREEWEPLDGKWYFADNSGHLLSDFAVYNVTVTKMGVLLYSINNYSLSWCEEYKSFGAYAENGFACSSFRTFIDDFCNNKMKEISNEDAIFIAVKLEEKKSLNEEKQQRDEVFGVKSKEIYDEIKNRVK